MDFNFSPEQLNIRRMAREFAEREIAPAVAEYDRAERFPIEIARQMGQLGMLGGVIPEQYGGAGMDHLSLALLIEEIARHCHNLAAIAGFPSGLVGGGLLRYGTAEQQEQYLKPLAQGKVFAGAGVTEPRSGTDVAAMETTARRDGDSYVVNGTKTWISNLDYGSWFISFAQMDKAKRHKGITAFIFPKGSPGLEIRSFKNKVGFRPLSTGDLIFNNCRIPIENRVGEEGQGFAVAMSAVQTGRLGVAARACGIIRACLDESVRYAKERIVFDQPIGRFQLIQSKIADMVIGLDTAQYLTYRLAWLKDQGEQRAGLETSMAKLYATDTLMKVATDAAQIFGAYACSDEYPVGRYFRDAKFFQVVEGTSELHRVLIAEHALGYRHS
jgi:alkylation response protein AidB-like acyl-CoA dehydrogenase